MRKKILIIDYTTHHPEVVGALTDLFCEHDVTIAVTSSFKEKFAKDFDFSAGRIIIKPKKMSIPGWLALIGPVAAEQDIVLFSTAIRGPLLLETLKLHIPAKKIAFVHNSHYFAGKFPLTFGDYGKFQAGSVSWLLAVARYIPLKANLLKRNARHLFAGTGFESIAEHVDVFCFGNEHLARYFSELTGRKNVVNLPISIGTKHLPRPDYDNILRVAIIGTISPQRRNYEEVIRALGGARLTGSLELHLLGGCHDQAYARKLQDIIGRIANKKFTVKFDPGIRFIPGDQMLEKLKDIHVLLSPILVDFLFQLHQERYGLTKLSGAEYDCLRFNRPILLPADYRCSEQTKEYVLNYAGPDDLAEKIIALQSAESLAALNSRSNNSLSENSNTNIADEFLRKIESV